MRALSSLIKLAGIGLCLTAGAGPVAAGPDSGWTQKPHVALRLTAAALKQGVGTAPWAAVELKLERGWKIYWRSPGEAGVPTTFDWSASENLHAVETRWPRPKRTRIWGVDTVGYGGEIMFPAALRLADPTAPTLVHVRVAYGVCREICIPDEAVLALKVAPDGWARPGEAERIHAALALVPDPGNEPALVVRRAAIQDDRLVIDADSADPAVAPDLFLEGPPGLRFGPTVAMLGDDRRRLRFEVPLQGSVPGPAALVLTFVDGPRAFERRVTLPAR